MAADGRKRARKRNPKFPELPHPDEEFDDLSAMLAAGYGWWEWHSLPAVVRGRIRAHLVERSIFEAYELAAMDNTESDKKAAGGGYDAAMDSFWGPAKAPGSGPASKRRRGPSAAGA